LRWSEEDESASTSPFAGLRFREIGPASTSGCIDDFAVLESNPAVFYVTTATGGLWKIVNQSTIFPLWASSSLCGKRMLVMASQQRVISSHGYIFRNGRL
jgi:hypothetical protein